MSTILMAWLILSYPQAAPPAEVFDLSGVWKVTASGTQFRLNQEGPSVQISLRGESDTYIDYELTLEPTDQPNVYSGLGFFVALRGTEECRFDIDWQLAAVSAERIIGTASTVIPEPEGCGVQDRISRPVNLERVE